MTAQVNDTVKYDGIVYAIAGISGEALFDPASLGIEPAGLCSACWRGFVCHYEVRAQGLTLSELELSLDGRSQAPTVFGVPPGERGLWGIPYKGIDQLIPFSGGLLLGDGFIEEMYVHMGFHPAYAYRRVQELIFDQGRLTKATDLSADMAKCRREIGGREDQPSADKRKDVMGWIEQRFSRDYTR